MSFRSFSSQIFSKGFFATLFLGLFAGALGGGATAALIFQQIRSEGLSEQASSAVIQFEGGSYQSVYSKAAPAVVSVVALKDLSQIQQSMPFQFGPFGFFQMPSRPSTPEGREDSDLTKVSSGTGFIFTPDGFVITNKHVVSDPEARYAVILNDGTQLDAKVLDQDSLNDIAFLQITGEDERIGTLPHLNFGNSEAVSVGDPVVAIGNVLGEYSNTMTVGILSAVDRQIVASGAGFGSENLVNLLQTDAAINPGNSGGPLLNILGEVIGMNTAIDSTAQGIGFAIPSNDIAAVVTSYQEHGKIVRAYLGVSSVPVTEQLKQHFDLEVDHGAYVIGDVNRGPGVVEGSPADEAGLLEGDVILSVDGKDIDERFTLQNAVAAYQVGDTVKMELLREGETLTLEVKLGERE